MSATESARWRQRKRAFWKRQQDARPRDAMPMPADVGERKERAKRALLVQRRLSYVALACRMPTRRDDAYTRTDDICCRASTSAPTFVAQERHAELLRRREFEVIGLRRNIAKTKPCSVLSARPVLSRAVRQNRRITPGALALSPALNQRRRPLIVIHSAFVLSYCSGPRQA